MRRTERNPYENDHHSAASRPSRDLREKAEAVLKKGESLSGFMLDALTRNIEYRQMRHKFIARGIASGEAARKSDVYVSADKVIEKLERRLAKAKRRRAG